MRCNRLINSVLVDLPAAAVRQANRVICWWSGLCAARVCSKKEGGLEIRICRPPGLGFVKLLLCVVKNQYDQQFIPPQQLITWPVTYAERSLARKTATLATSSGLPQRLRGICFSHSVFTFSGRAPVMSVSMNPGAMQFALIPRGPISFAIDFARTCFVDSLVNRSTVVVSVLRVQS